MKRPWFVATHSEPSREGSIASMWLDSSTGTTSFEILPVFLSRLKSPLFVPIQSILFPSSRTMFTVPEITCLRVERSDFISRQS